MIDIPYEAIARTVGLAAPGIAALAGFLRGPGARRAKIDRNVELWERLPEGSSARAVVGDWLDNQVSNLRNFETEAKRDIQGMVISAFLTGAFAALTIWLISLGAWCWYLLSVIPGVFVPVGLASTFDDAQLQSVGPTARGFLTRIPLIRYPMPSR